MQKVKAGAAAVALAVAVAACGTTTPHTAKTIHPAGTNPTGTVDTNAYKQSKLTQQQAANAFTNMIVPVNAALSNVGKELQKLGAGTGGSVIGRLAAPAAAALTKLNTELQQLADKYPVAADNLSNLEQSYQPLIADLKDLKHIDASNYQAWERQFAKHVARIETADRAVRNQLGIPKKNQS